MEINAIVKSNVKIAENIYDMHICWQDAELCCAGQFINILCEGSDALLRRPISVCDSFGDTLRIVYEVKGKGTKLLSRYNSGSEINFLAPLGHGFEIDANVKNPVIIGGGIGTYPLLKLAKSFNSPAVFLGFRNKSFMTLVSDFENISDLHIATDDGSFGHHGYVTELAEEYIKTKAGCAVFACGPRPMLINVKKLAEKYSLPCQISMEERMGCGIGACLVCACKTKDSTGSHHYKHVCKNGPVFDAREIVFD